MSDLVQQARNTQQGKTVMQLVAPYRASLMRALAERVGVERFVQAVSTEARKTPRLLQCDEESLLGGMFVAAQLGLEIGGPRGYAYLVPYWNKKKRRLEAQLIIGFKGLLELAYRSGQIRKVDAFIVREGDEFRQRWDYQHGRVFDWQPGDYEPDSALAKPVGVIAYVVNVQGGLLWDYLPEAEVLKRRPEDSERGPWSTWPDEMWMKTALRHLLKRVRLSADDASMSLAVDADQTVQRRVPGLSDPVVERVPVAGEKAIGGPSGQRQEPEDPGDEEPDWAQREREEQAAWYDAQAAMDRGGETP